MKATPPTLPSSDKLSFCCIPRKPDTDAKRSGSLTRWANWHCFFLCALDTQASGLPSMGEPSTVLKKYHLSLVKVPWDFLNEPDSQQPVCCQPCLLPSLDFWACMWYAEVSQNGCTRVSIFLCSALGLGFEVSLFQRTELKFWIRLSRKFFQLSFNLAMKIKLSTLLHFPQWTYCNLKNSSWDICPAFLTNSQGIQFLHAIHPPTVLLSPFLPLKSPQYGNCVPNTAV